MTVYPRVITTRYYMGQLVTSKGQVTIPKDLRNELHIKTGDEVEFIKDN